MSSTGVPKRIKPIYLTQRSSHWYATTTIGIGLFTDAFLYSVVIPILPYSLQRQYGIPEDEIQFWTSTTVISYGAAVLVASPVIGLIADSTKARRWPYMFGLLMLLVAISIPSFGHNVLLVVAARVLQGVSVTIVWVVGLALLVDMVGDQNIGRAIGLATLGSSVAILIGPALGGVIYDRAGLSGIFFVSLGLLMFNFVLRALLVEKSTAISWLEPEDGIKTASRSTTSTNTTKFHRSRSLRMFPVLSLLTSGRLLCAVFSTFISAILISTFDAVIPLFVKNTLDLSSAKAGLVFAAVILPGLLSPLIGWFCDRYGARWIVSSGYILFAPALLCLRLVTSDDLPQIILFCGLLVVIGLCYVMVNVPILGEYTFVVGHKEKMSPGSFGTKGVYAQAYGIYNSAYAAGMLTGPLLSGFIMDSYGWAVLTASLAICCSLTAVVTAVFCGERKLIHTAHHGTAEGMIV